MECGIKIDRNYLDLVQNCGFYFCLEGFCIATERPTEINLRNGRLHKDGSMAIKYESGWGLYYFDGIKVPEKYGTLKSENWEAKWILEEKNAELRRVLIQGIGYGKICRDLKAQSLDSWKEYELLKIDNADVEPIVMVKMICPSTGLIHSHRVPPNIKTAREGIKWCNWGIDKEEFLIER